MEGEAQRESKSREEESFLQKIIAFILRNEDPEKEKRRLLKQVAKDLKKQKYKFYKPKAFEAQPALARFFHELYKIAGPAQVLLENAGSSGVLKTIIIERSLSKGQLAIKDYLEEDNIRKLAETTDTKVLSQELKDKLINFFSAFSAEKVKQIDNLYNLLVVFLRFINFDYYFFLKKFDSGLPEHDFVYLPKFEAISGEYISDDLKDFLEVMPLVIKGSDWETLFEILKEYRSAEVVGLHQWKKLLKAMEDVYKSDVLQLMVRHIDEDPYYKVKVFPPEERIVDEYLSRIKTQVEITIQKILRERQDRKMERLSNLVFGTSVVTRTKYYTEKANMAFSKKMLGGFVYTAPLNYLKAFLLDYFKKDIKTMVDVLLIRGKWSTNLMSQQLSESFHELMQTSEQLIAFDDSLAEEGEQGTKLKNLVYRADKDKNSLLVLRKLLKEINDRALLLIQDSAQNFIVIGKNIKMLIEDYEKKPHEVILNWKEIESAVEGDIKENLSEIYKKIYYFIKLIQLFIKKSA